MSTTQIPKILPKIDGPGITCWDVTVHGVDLRVEQKKNRYGIPLEKVYVYTRGDGTAYYATTSLATFSQKYWFEQTYGVRLAREETF